MVAKSPPGVPSSEPPCTCATSEKKFDPRRRRRARTVTPSPSPRRCGVWEPPQDRDNLWVCLGGLSNVGWHAERSRWSASRCSRGACAGGSSHGDPVFRLDASVDAPVRRSLPDAGPPPNEGGSMSPPCLPDPGEPNDTVLGHRPYALSVMPAWPPLPPPYDFPAAPARPRPARRSPPPAASAPSPRRSRAPRSAPALPCTGPAPVARPPPARRPPRATRAHRRRAPPPERPIPGGWSRGRPRASAPRRDPTRPPRAAGRRRARSRPGTRRRTHIAGWRRPRFASHGPRTGTSAPWRVAVASSRKHFDRKTVSKPRRSRIGADVASRACVTATAMSSRARKASRAATSAR